MSATERMVTILLAGTALIVFLFVSAPTELPDGKSEQASPEATVPVAKVLAILAAENDVARSLYTSQIVGAGKAVGLQFSEHWQDASIEAGPLPALFLRSTAAEVFAVTPDLGLFLGSEYPIAASNLFSDSQMQQFRKVAENGEAVMFPDAGANAFTAMYPDYASVQACVTCHNEHPDSPKNDWKLQDIMGATTWTYPRDRVSAAEALQLIRSLRNGFIQTYTRYVEKARGFSRAPQIGDKWPSGGDYCLPAPEEFAAEFERRAALATSTALLELVEARGEE